jgi:hypothetical protein
MVVRDGTLMDAKLEISSAPTNAQIDLSQKVIEEILHLFLVVFLW